MRLREHIMKYAEYDPMEGFRKQIYEGARLRFQIKENGELLIDGNRMGLQTLAETLIALVQPGTGLGYHVHLDPGFDYPGEGMGFILQLNEDGKHGEHDDIPKIVPK